MGFALHPAIPVTQLLARPDRASRNASSRIHALALWLSLAASTQRGEKTRTGAPAHEHASRRQALMNAANEMLRRATRKHQPLTVMVFELHDLPELERVFGAPVAKAALSNIAAKLERIAGRKGLVLHNSRTIFTVLLPGHERDAALAITHAAMGRSCCIELDSGGDDIVIVPDFSAQTAPVDATSVEKIQKSLCRDIAQARLALQHHRSVHRHHHVHDEPLRSEIVPREPATLQPARSGACAYPVLPATIPVPIGMRRQAAPHRPARTG